MSRNNGSFKYKPLQEAQRDPATGLYQPGSPTAWQPGSECQIEKFIPAKQRLGEDGQEHSYTYDVFIPKYVKAELSVGMQVQVIPDDGATDEFTIQGVDDLNRKYIEIWG